MIRNYILNIRGRFLSVVVLCVCLLNVPVVAYGHGANQDIQLKGITNGDIQIVTNNHGMFHKDNIFPGDSWAGKIGVVNNSDRDVSFVLETIDNYWEDGSLYNALRLEIFREGETIYSGSYNNASNPITEYMEIRGGETLILDCIATLPSSAKDKVKSDQLGSTWTFNAIYSSDAGASEGSERGDVSNDSDLSDTNIFRSSWFWIGCLTVIALVATALRFGAAKCQSEKWKK